VTERQAAQLNLQAEGWLAGLHLAALAMQASDHPEPISDFHGDDRFVADYINSEHLTGLKRSERLFLTRTSVLDRLSGPLCDAVLDRSGSSARLSALEKGNFFVVPLDRNREWYRYHNLFGDMLRAELERTEPETIPLLHRRAAGWFEDHGQPEAAVEHAAAAGDVDTAARLVSGYVMPLVRTGRMTAVERWFGLFDDPELLREFPAVAAFGAWVHALRGRQEDAERFAHGLESSQADGPMPDGTESPAAWSSLVQAMLCRRGVGQMRIDAGEALAGVSPGSYWLPAARLIHAMGVLLEGDVERGEALLRENAEASVGSGAIWAIVVTNAELALLALEREEVDEAAEYVTSSEELLRNQPIEEYLPASIQLAVGARLAQALGKAATARAGLVSAMRMRGHFSRVIPWFAVQTRLELARTHLALADADGARTLLREADDVLRQCPGLGILVEQADELRAQLANVATFADGWASTLTAAELRLLPLLTTHLSFREIAERLFVSRNTVKSQAISVYRKLDAASRSEAIDRAVELGLVDAPVSSGTPGFTRTG
jgi:LuxR family maltose regulon positive regulatory protein